MNRRLLLVVGVPLALAVLATGGTWAYINLIREDAPERLSLSNDDPATPAGSSAVGGSIEGTWRVSAGSQAGYRAKEVLFGQRVEAAGRTEKVTGEFVIAGERVTTGSFTVDMAGITSDESRRDNQYRGRIMAVSQFPTSTFKLAEPISLSGGETVSTSATGDLTVRGQTKRVTIKIDAKKAGDRIEVVGRHPMVWNEWGIPNPSFGPAEVDDRGELEFKLVFAKAS